MDFAVRLSDGRRMMVADVGDPHGIPVFYVAGYGHCRLARHPDDALAGEAGSGCWPSTHPAWAARIRYPATTCARGPGTRSSWPTSRASAPSPRSAGPGAARTRWRWLTSVPAGLASVGLVSALGGWLAGAGHVSQARKEHRNFASLCRWAPPLVKMFLARQRRGVLADPRAAQAKDLATAAPADQAAADQPGMAAMLRASQAEAWRQGTAGMFDHAHAVTLPWGFAPADVSVPASVWQGSADREIFPGMGEHLAAAMRHASLTVFPGEGHLLLFTHWAVILRQLAARQLETQERQ